MLLHYRASDFPDDSCKFQGVGRRGESLLWGRPEWVQEIPTLLT